MRPQAHSADHHQSCHLSLITCRYLRYILIRCLAYTNDRAVAERIAAYTLITSCLLSRRLGRMADLGLVIETMVQIVGDDQVISDKRQVISDGLEVEEATPAFVLDARMCDVAGAINSVDRFGRELLVLHHIEGLSTAELAQLQTMPIERIQTAIADAEHEFTGILRGLGWDHDVGPDVHGLLTGLAGCLDEESRRDVAVCAMQYLTNCT
jgi:DNA-directed RNA polymerase specialized sigma24 family protein